MKQIITGFLLVVVVGAYAAESFSRTSYVCVARSITGKRYSAVGTNEAITQDAALQECQKHSFRCFAEGCTKTEER